MLPRMTVAFVAGATGYTGREVVMELRSRGVTTVAHVRPDSARVDEWRDRFGARGASIDVTPWSAVGICDALAKAAPTHVFALLGTTRARGSDAKKGGKQETYETVDYGLTAMLLSAAKTCGRSPVFVYLSSAGVTQTTTNRYLAARAKVERELVGSGLPYRIARPSFITGADRDEDRPGERIGSMVADGALSLIGALGAKRLSSRYRSTSPQTLAKALVRLGLVETKSRVYESEELRA